MEVRKWNGETRISAQEYVYNDILQDFDFNFCLKLFSGVLMQAKQLFETMQTNSNDISYSSKKKVEQFREFFDREVQEL
jgi:hypothetical protein